MSGAGDRLLRDDSHANLSARSHRAHANHDAGLAFSWIATAVGGAISGVMRPILISIAFSILGVLVAVGLIWFLAHRAGIAGLLMRSAGANKDVKRVLDTMPPNMRQAVDTAAGTVSASEQGEPPQSLSAGLAGEATVAKRRWPSLRLPWARSSSKAGSTSTGASAAGSPATAAAGATATAATSATIAVPPAR